MVIMVRLGSLRWDFDLFGRTAVLDDKKVYRLSRPQRLAGPRVLIHNGVGNKVEGRLICNDSPFQPGILKDFLRLRHGLSDQEWRLSRTGDVPPAHDNVYAASFRHARFGRRTLFDDGVLGIRVGRVISHGSHLKPESVQRKPGIAQGPAPQRWGHYLYFSAAERQINVPVFLHNCASGGILLNHCPGGVLGIRTRVRFHNAQFCRYERCTGFSKRFSYNRGNGKAASVVDISRKDNVVHEQKEGQQTAHDHHERLVQKVLKCVG